MATIGTDQLRAAELLANGEIVAIPTETVYGLAANALDPDAVLKVFQAKQRPSFDPLIVHVHSQEQLGELVQDPPPGARELMGRFWPGPLTLVLPKTAVVPDIVTSGLDTVGLRMPAHPVAQALLRRVDFPLAAPSANPFGFVSPTTAAHVEAQLGGVVPYILDGGPCTVGVESTIMGWESGPGRWVVYRPGGVPIEAIEACIGPVTSATHADRPAAPGMLENHYAPGKRLEVGDVVELLAKHQGRRAAVIAFHRLYPHAGSAWVLSPAADLAEAARNLFAAIREADASDAEVILAERFPEEGLGRAINDRLRRASAKRV